MNVSCDNVVFIADLFYTGRKLKTMAAPVRNSFRLVLMEIKRTYFDHGLRELMREKYFLIGIVFGR